MGFSGAYRAWQGHWQLVALATLVALISEREQIAKRIRLEEAGRAVIWLPLILLGVFWGAQIEPTSALSILRFWIAWELG